MGSAKLPETLGQRIPLNVWGFVLRFLTNNNCCVIAEKEFQAL